MEEWRLEVIREIEGLEKERRGIFKRIERITQGTITKISFQDWNRNTYISRNYISGFPPGLTTGQNS